jgi:DNA repair protein RadA/Sms
VAKSFSVYVCQQCGFQTRSFLGKCPQCDNWNSFVEQLVTKSSADKPKNILSSSKPVNLSDVEKKDFERISSKIEEFDRVLGGGVVPGSLILLAGDPGIGKSTLLTQLALNVDRILYVAGEESAHQIKIRVDRISPKANFLVLNETDVDVIKGVIEEVKPKMVIIDSIQTLETSDLESVPGSVGQVRESASRLQRVAKSLHVPIILVGHVTKEGTVAGPKTLEHVVDVVLSLEGDGQNQFRILRGLKNRFGPTDEVGVFEMVEAGMSEVKNPSKLFLEEKVSAPGSSVVPILTGLRPILVEIQALVTKTSLPSPRRTGSGIDNNRLQLLVAVLQKRLGLPLYDQDVFVNVTGGLKIFEPAADLAICMAIISSFKDITLDSKTVFVGEVGLLGEIRMVRGLDKRTSEATKLGFTSVISAEKAGGSSGTKNLSQVTKLLLK